MINKLILMSNQCRVCGHLVSVLTVQVTLPDPLHVLSMNELVAPFPHDVHRSQIHVVADPETQKHSEFHIHNLNTPKQQ